MASTVRHCVLMVFPLLMQASLAWSGELQSPPHEATDTPTSARVLRVGPHQSYTRISDAALAARDGDTVLIDPGDYVGDTASWPQNDLTLHAERCCARLSAAGHSAEDKAIWVIKGNNVRVENIEFRGARVADQNGAGIRQEGPGRLLVRNCRFTENEIGLLTSLDPHAELIVEQSEFDHNRIGGPHRRDDPVGHQIYVGRIGRFTLRDSYVHAGYLGHLVKSRARENHIYNNRLTDEMGGQASYELEFPDGGVAYVIGNIIEQSATTENRTMISFAAERFYWQRNELYLVNNTLVDDTAGLLPILYVRSGSGRVKVQDNLVAAPRRIVPLTGLLASNAQGGPDDMPLAGTGDYRLKFSSPLVGTAVEPGTANGISLRPDREYVHPRHSQAIARSPYSPGALQSLIP